MNSVPDKVRFIINPISGINRKPKKIVKYIEDIWGVSGKKHEIVFTREKGHATELAQEAVNQDFEMVVAVGGDGTINEIGRGLIDSDVALGIIPAGSGNGFARNFNIPLDQQKATRALLNVSTQKIDVGKINSHYFFNVAGLGLDATISAHFEQFGVRGPIPYFLVGCREFFKYKPREIHLIFDHRELKVRPLLLSIANAPQYGNGAIIAPNARPDDGLLDFCILQPLSAFQAVRRLPMLFNGTIHHFEGMQIIQASHARIERATADYIHTDGDPYFEDATLEITILPGRLRVAIPV